MTVETHQPADRGVVTASGRIGIMGGTFDPIHYGHLIMAESVMHSVNADGMLFVPARAHPFKAQEQLADYDHRARMVRLAIENNARFRLETPPPGCRYTVDLIDYLKNNYPATEFFLPVGSDIIEEFHAWYRHDDIERNIRIVIAARPGYRPKSVRRDVLKSAEQVVIPQYDVSSTEIRKRVASQMSIKYLVPDPVLEYIAQTGLYIGENAQ